MMLERLIPIFDGKEDAYWWLIQLKRYFEANIWITEKMKVDWVTLYAFRGEASNWWSYWKNGKQNATWKIFERGFIQKFIPDLWDMLESAEGEEQESHEYVLNENTENYEESKEVGKETNSGSLLSLSGIEPPPERSHQEFHVTPFTKCMVQKSAGHNESVVVFETIINAATETQRGEKERRIVPDLHPPPETPDPPSSQSPPPESLDSSQPATDLQRREPPPKPPDWSSSDATRDWPQSKEEGKEPTINTQHIPPPLKWPEPPGINQLAMVRPLPTTSNTLATERLRFNVASVGKDCEVKRITGSIVKVGISFNLMDQTQVIFCLVWKVLEMWTGIELLGSVQFNDSHWVMKKGVAIVDDTNQNEKNSGTNWSGCMLDLTINLVGQAQNNSSKWVREIKRWSNVESPDSKNSIKYRQPYGCNLEVFASNLFKQSSVIHPSVIKMLLMKGLLKDNIRTNILKHTIFQLDQTGIPSQGHWSSLYLIADKFIQVKGEGVTKYNKVVLSILLKTRVILFMSRRNMEVERELSLPSTLNIEISSMVVMALIDDVLGPWHVKYISCRLPTNYNGSGIVWMTRSLEMGLSGSHQWDPGGNDSVFEHYSTMRVFGEFIYQEIQCLIAIVLVVALLCAVATVVLLKLFMFNCLGDLQATCVKATLVVRNDKMYSNQFSHLSLEDTAVFLVVGSTLSLYFKLWDPGGHLCYPSP
jgi:hypothetical protein